VSLDGFWPVFGVGCLGGLAVEAYKWFLLRDDSTPEYGKHLKYWIITTAIVLVGGGVTVLYGYHNVSAILAFNIGASAPAIIRTFAANPPKKAEAPSGAPSVSPSTVPSLSVRGFLAG
jgi:hypothetical protein